MRLQVFNLFKGDWIAAKALFDEVGLDAAKIGVKVRAAKNPFSEYNIGKQLSKNEKDAQLQMGPMVSLYKVLLEEGYSKPAALKICGAVAKAVAVAFLDFNVPYIEKRTWQPKPQEEKEQLLSKTVKRFFNVAEADESVSSNDHFKMTVKKCHFAEYAKVLNVPELGPVFCAADGYYFQHKQPDIQFSRTQTLTDETPKPCNFSFEWKDGNDRMSE